MPVYTKKGDLGNTSLLKGKIVSKSNLVVEALGNIDELNASLGQVRLTKRKKIFYLIGGIQEELFYLGALLAGYVGQCDVLKNVSRLEKLIDEYDSKNRPIHEFVIPGGCDDSCRLHLARAICRRTERSIVRIRSLDPKVRNKAITYLNRLSDLLFVLARYVNLRAGVQDIIWKKNSK